MYCRFFRRTLDDAFGSRLNDIGNKDGMELVK